MPVLAQQRRLACEDGILAAGVLVGVVDE